MGPPGSGRSGSGRAASGGHGLSPPPGAWPECGRRLPRPTALKWVSAGLRRKPGALYLGYAPKRVGGAAHGGLRAKRIVLVCYGIRAGRISSLLPVAFLRGHRAARESPKECSWTPARHNSDLFGCSCGEIQCGCLFAK